MKLTRIFEIRVNLSGNNFLSAVPATGKGVETHDISDNECKGFIGVSRTPRNRGVWIARSANHEFLV